MSLKEKMHDLGEDIRDTADELGRKVERGYDDVKDKVEAGYEEAKIKVEDGMSDVRREADRVGDDIKDSRIVRDADREAHKLDADVRLAADDVKDEYYKIKEEI